MAKISDGLAAAINNPEVIQAANNAAAYYEKVYSSLNQRHYKDAPTFNSDMKDAYKDIEFSSRENTPFSALLRAIIKYASVNSTNPELTNEESYSANAKDSVFKPLSIPQYATGIKDAFNSGVVQWKYSPYKLVYPAVTPKGMSRSTIKALQRTSGSVEQLMRFNYDKKFNKYRISLEKNLIFTPDTTGGAAAQKLNTVLESRKLVTPDFNMDNESDKLAVNFVNLVNKRLPADEGFRKEFFKYAEEFKGSQFQKYSNYCGFDDNAITEYSSL